MFAVSGTETEKGRRPNARSGARNTGLRERKRMEVN